MEVEEEGRERQAKAGHRGATRAWHASDEQHARRSGGGRRPLPVALLVPWRAAPPTRAPWCCRCARTPRWGSTSRAFAGTPQMPLMAVLDLPLLRGVRHMHCHVRSDGCRTDFRRTYSTAHMDIQILLPIHNMRRSFETDLVQNCDTYFGLERVIIIIFSEVT